MANTLTRQEITRRQLALLAVLTTTSRDGTPTEGMMAITDQLGNVREPMPERDWPTQSFGNHGRVIAAWRWISPDGYIVAEEFTLESGRTVRV